MRMSTNFRTITNFTEFLRLKEAWNDLVRNTEVDHAFMRHEWFECWIKYLGDPGRISVITGWSNDQLVFIAPLQIVPTKVGGLPIKSLTFLMSHITPRCNFIVHPMCQADEIFNQVLHHPGWGLMNLRGMEEDKNVTRRFISFLEQKRSNRFEVEQARKSPYVIVEGNWNDYLSGLTRKHRKNINQGLNRISKLESCSLEKCNDYQGIEKVFDDVLGISDRSWKKAGGSSIGAVPNLSSFYREFCRLGEKDNLWELRLLRAENKYVAFNFFLKEGNRLSGIRTDYDDEYRYYGPGQIMILLTLRELFEDGRQWEFDMGGMASDFKLDWTDKTRNHIDIMATAPGYKGELLAFGKRKILPFVRRMRGLWADGKGKSMEIPPPHNSLEP